MKRRTGVVIGAAILVIVICGSTVYMAVTPRRDRAILLRHLAAAPFLEQYEAFKANNPPRPYTASKAAPDIHSKGKYLVLCPSSPTCDDSWFELPDNLKASTPEEVKTLVWAKWIGVYTKLPGGANGYQIIADVQVIDRETNVVLGHLAIKGPITVQDTRWFARARKQGTPMAQVVEYLTELAR